MNKQIFLGIFGFCLFAAAACSGGSEAVETVADSRDMMDADAGRATAVIDAGTLVPSATAEAPTTIEDTDIVTAIVEEESEAVTDAGVGETEPTVAVEDAGTEEEVPVLVEDAGTDVAEPTTGEEENERSCLVAVLSESTPEASIVTPPSTDEKRGWQAFSRYDISNMCEEDVFMNDVVVRHLGDTGALTHFQYLYVGVAADDLSAIGATVGWSVAISEGTQEETVRISKPADQGIWFPAGATRAVVLRGIMDRPEPQDVEGAAHSGDAHALKLTSIGCADCSELVLEDHETPFMVLRNAKPEIVQLPVGTAFIAPGAYTEALKFQVTAVDGPVSFAQLQFDVQTSEDVSWTSTIYRNAVPVGEAMGWSFDPSEPIPQDADCYYGAGLHCNKGSHAVRRWFSEEIVLEEGASAVFTFLLQVVAAPVNSVLTASFVLSGEGQKTTTVEYLNCNNVLGPLGYGLSGSAAQPFMIWSDWSEEPHSLRSRCLEDSWSSMDWIGDALLPSLDPVTLTVIE
ncbi:MAG: hypothetical protein RL141_466 [Candidatus Parcubacteria bacterium]|jgi:hypothetical protein